MKARWLKPVRRFRASFGLAGLHKAPAPHRAEQELAQGSTARGGGYRRYAIRAMNQIKFGRRSSPWITLGRSEATDNLSRVRCTGQPELRRRMRLLHQRAGLDAESLAV
jgi:hypothetical protein